MPTEMRMKALDAESKLFDENRFAWCEAHRGEFVVVQDNHVAGFYPDWETALKAGYKAFGVSRPFLVILVKQVLMVDPVYFVGALKPAMTTVGPSTTSQREEKEQ